MGGFFVLIAVVVGLVKRLGKPYWLRVLGAYVLTFVVNFLFSARGTLERPDGDGVITHMVRVATGDGPLLPLIMFPVVLILGGALPLMIIHRAYKAEMAKRAAVGPAPTA